MYEEKSDSDKCSEAKPLMDAYFDCADWPEDIGIEFHCSWRDGKNINKGLKTFGAQ